MATYKVYQDTDFTVGDDGVVIDFLTDLGASNRNVLMITGHGAINLSVSYDEGSSFGESTPIDRHQRVKHLNNRSDQIKLNHTGEDSSYVIIAYPGNELFDIESIYPYEPLDAVQQIVTITVDNTTAVVALAPNPNRHGFIVSDGKNKKMYVRPEPAATNPTIKEGVFVDFSMIDPFIWPEQFPYTGEVSMIADSAASTEVQVIEF